MIPVLIFDEFISPLKCQSDNVLDFAISKANLIVPNINKHFGVDITEVTGTIVSPSTVLQCGRGYFKYGWVKTNTSSFMGYIPLKNYNKETPFDIETDVYGGDMILTQYKNKLYPEMGKLCVFPSSPNFAHHFNDVQIGELKIIKLLFKCDDEYSFDYMKWSTNWEF
jgi:hypothetical protein